MHLAPKKFTFNKSQYMQKVHQYNRICMRTKSEFLTTKIQESHHNPQKLWRVLGNVLHRLPAMLLPYVSHPQLLANRFNEFFTDKIYKIGSAFPVSFTQQRISHDTPPTFSTFSTVTEDQVAKIITHSPSRSCYLTLGPLFLSWIIWTSSFFPSLQ